VGLIYSRIKLLLDAKICGTDFSNTAMIGRQKISLSKKENKKIETIYGLNIEKDNFNFKERDYADLLIKKYLDIKELKIIDYSDYQGATIKLDLNFPIPDHLHNKFDVLIDGGSIEHIFNFPVAIKNYMNMVKMNGSIFIFTNANNHCGHGFYQFSPELFYRVFNEANGFELKSIILVKHPFPGAELSEKQICYTVADPKEIGRRSTIVTKSPLGIMVHAKKIKEKEIFSQFPMQSDYTKLWEGGKNKRLSKENSIKIKIRSFFRFLPRSLMKNIQGFKQLHDSSLKNDKEFYTKWD